MTALLLLLTVLLGVLPGTTAPQPYWVYLDNQSTREVRVTLSEAELAVRRQAGLPLYPNDRGIRADVIARIAATGAQVRTTSRWLGAVSVDASPAELRALKRLAFVERVEPVARMRVERDPAVAQWVSALAAAAAAGSAEQDSAFYGPNYRALALLNIPKVHELGRTGAGIRVAIFDTGFDLLHESLRQRLVGRQYDFINGDSAVANAPGEAAIQEVQGTWVWSLMGGLLEGVIVGPAYNATYYLAKTDVEPGDTHADEDRWVAAAEWAVANGVRIVCSALTYRYEFTDGSVYTFQQMDGSTTRTTRAAQELARRGVLLVQSIGNTAPGDGTLVAPSDADSIISVGAVDFEGKPFAAAISGRGPTARGITKPELVAPAFELQAASSTNNASVNRPLSGATFATPLIAGGAALFMDFWPDLNAQAVRRALLLAGSNAENANNIVGWGIPDIGAAIMFPEGITASTVAQSDFNGVVASISPTLRWDAQVHPLTRPVRYIVEVARDSLFRQLLLTDTTVDAFSLQVERALLPGTTFYWRVTGSSPNGITRVSNLGVSPNQGAFTIAAWVRQLNFVEVGATTDSAHPTLRWLPIEAPAPAGPFTYDVEVLSHATGDVVQRVRNLADSVHSVRLPTPLSPNQPFRWQVIARVRNGAADTVTSVQPFVVNSAEAPPATILYQNFPNPFPRLDLGRTRTSIWFDLAEDASVELTVHDPRGRMVRSLIPARGCAPVRLPAGIYGRAGQSFNGDDCVLTTWDGRDENGDRVPRGVYVLRLIANGKVEYRRMLYQPND